ncbi:hypothetical protein N9383_02050 [Granulosicoccus sp.]|nr:hypothetical protein [Granulosicoccus sp.]
MKDLRYIIARLLTTIAKLLGPGGARVIVVDSLLTKQQLLIINRTRRQSPKLKALDCFLMGLCSLFLLQRHIRKAAVIIQPSTLFEFYQLLKQGEYRRRYTSGRKTKPGPKGSSIGFGIHTRAVDGVLLCCMFNKILSGRRVPQRLSSDNDPLFR